MQRLAALSATLLCSAALAQPQPLTVCVAADNPPLSHMVNGQPKGLDLRIAQAAADSLGRPLKVVPFESEYEKESTLAHEIAALLSAGLCDAASGFPLLTGDFGPPTRASARTPDYPGAKRKRDRPYVTLQAMAPGRGYVSVALGVVLPAGGAPLDKLTDLGAVMLPLALFDGWRLQHPGATLVAAGWRRPIGVNLGFVTLQTDTAVRPAIDAVVTRALADGSLQRWAVEEGVTWSPPVQPDVGRAPSMLELVAE